MSKEIISLAHMKDGQKGVIASIAGGTGVHERLRNMGLLEGKELVKMSQFRFWGPVTVKVGQTVLAIGHGMASKVMVQVE